MKTKVWKRILPLFLTVVMLFSVFASAIPASALSVAAPTEDTNEAYYRVAFEDGVLRIQLNPQKVYEMLQDRRLTKEELSNFIPANILETLEKGRDLTVEDLKELALQYVSKADLQMLKDMIPADIIRDYFDLSMLEGLISVDELLSVVSIDDILAGIDEDKIAGLITPEAMELLLNEKAKNAVLTDKFVEGLLNESNILDEILKDEALRADLAELIDGEIVEQLLADEKIKADLMKLIEAPDTLDNILADDVAMNALTAYFEKNQDKVSKFLADKDVIDILKSIDEIRDTLLTDAVVEGLLKGANPVLDKEMIRTVFTDAQLKSLVTDDVVEALLSNTAFVNSLMGNKPLLDKIVTDALLTELLNANVFDGRIEAADVMPTNVDWNAVATAFAITADDFKVKFGLDPIEMALKYGVDATVNELIEGEGITTEAILAAYPQITVKALIDNGFVEESALYRTEIIEDILKNDANGRAIVAASVNGNSNVTLDDYWEYIELNVLVDAIGVSTIRKFVEDNDDVYQKLLAELSGEDLTNALGADVCTAIMQDNAATIIKAVGMPKMFEYFNRDEIVAELGGYYTIIDRGYVKEDQVIEAIGGYEALLDYLDLDDVINVVGYDRLLDYVNFADVIESAGGYDKVASWYTNDELTAIAEAIGTDTIKDFIQKEVLPTIDVKKIAFDILDILRSKVPEYKALLKRIGNKLLVIFNREVANITVNGMKIYKTGRFDMEAMIVALMQMIPDVDHFVELKSGDPVAQFVIGMALGEKTYQMGVSIEFIGDFSKIQNLLAPYADYYRFDVSDDMDITTEVALPLVVANVYEAVLMADRVPAGLKEKVLLLPANATVEELEGFLADLTDAELQAIVDAVYDKVDAIRAKAYAKLDAVAGDNAKLEAGKDVTDKILGYFDNMYRLKELRNKLLAALDRIPDGVTAATISDLYEGNSKFHANGNFSVDGVAYLKKLIARMPVALPDGLVDNLLVYFGNDLTLDGTLDASLTVSGIYELTLLDSKEQTFVFYLPAGMPLEKLNQMVPALSFTFEKGAVMPAADTTMYDPSLWWKVEFYADNVYVDSAYYLKGSEALDPEDIPEVPAKPGYVGNWPEFELNKVNVLRVDAEYHAKELVRDLGGFVIRYKVTDRHLNLPLIPPAMRGYVFDTWYIDVNLNDEIDGEDLRLERIVPKMMRFSLKARSVTYEWADFALPDGYQLPDDPEQLNVIANYVIGEYTITFEDEDGTPMAGSVTYTAFDNKDALAAQFPTVEHYDIEWFQGTVAWKDVDLFQGGDIVLRADKTPVEYTVTFIADGKIVDTDTYNVEDLTIKSVALPAKAGYTGDWYVTKVGGQSVTATKWSEYTLTYGDVIVEAKYETITYKAYFRVDGTIIDTVEFVVTDKALSRVPTVPAKLGYNGKWEAYTIKAEDLYIDAEYTLIQYTATFIADDQVVATVNFTINDKTITEPEVPAKEGYVGVWESYQLGAADIVIHAIYTPIGATTPEGSTPGTTPGTDIGGEQEEEGTSWLWLIILILVIVIVALVIVLLVLYKKKQNPEDGGDDNDTTPPAVEEEVEEVADVETEETVEVAPVEEVIEVVESVDVETADALMTDDQAMAVVEMVEIAGQKETGPKEILNLHVINDKFEANDTVDLEALKAKKLVPAKTERIKILADGTLDKPLTVIADSFSVQAIKMITLTGGHAVQKKNKIVEE